MTNTNLISQLEKNLLQFQRSQETKKTLMQWKLWLQKRGLSLSEDFSYTSTDILNWREFLAECEQIPDEFAEQLANPQWLQQQGVFLFALESPQKSSTLQQRLAKLEEAVEQLQEQMRLLSIARPPKEEVIKSESSQKNLTHHSSLQKDLAVLNLKNKTEEEQPPEKPYQIEPLNEVYLTTVQWFKVLQRENAEAFVHLGEQFTESSHRISFLQMKVRLLRYAQEPSLVEDALQHFEDSVAEGVLLDSFILGSQTQTEEENEPEELPHAPKEVAKVTKAGLELPSEELYQNMSAWIQWFADQGFHLQDLTTQDLLNHSSHQISFMQFCKRIERQLDDQETFQQWIND